MDVENDSDLETLSDLEIDEDSGIQPYRFEPTRRNSDSSQTDEDSSDSSDSDGENRQKRRVRAIEDLPEVSTW